MKRIEEQVDSVVLDLESVYKLFPYGFSPIERTFYSRNQGLFFKILNGCWYNITNEELFDVAVKESQ